MEPSVETLAVRLDAHLQLDEIRHHSEAVALTKSEEQLSRRLDDMNNFRQQIEDERLAYMTRELYDREHKEINRRVGVLEEAAAATAGAEKALALRAADNSKNIAIIISVITAAISVLVLIAKHFFVG